MMKGQNEGSETSVKGPQSPKRVPVAPASTAVNAIGSRVSVRWPDRKSLMEGLLEPRGYAVASDLSRPARDYELFPVSLVDSAHLRRFGGPATLILRSACEVRP